MKNCGVIFGGDIEVISPAFIDRNNLVIIGVNSCVKEIFKQLISLGIGQEHIFVPDKQWWIGATPQYFDPEILSPGMNEVFVDGGSLDGSDSLNFIEWCKGVYKAIYAFEPDGGSLRKLYELAEKNKHMQVFEEGLWSEEAALSFSSGKAENCAVSADGDSVIRVTSIDKKLEEKRFLLLRWILREARWRHCLAQQIRSENRDRNWLYVYITNRKILSRFLKRFWK